MQFQNVYVWTRTNQKKSEQLYFRSVGNNALFQGGDYMLDFPELWPENNVEVE